MKRTTINFETLLTSVSKEEFEEYYFSHSRKETQKHFNIGSTVFDRFRDYYGIKKPKERILEVRSATNMERYDVENQFQRTEYLKEACIAKNGSLEAYYAKIGKRAKEKIAELGYNPSHTKEVDEKRKCTVRQKYGCDYACQSQCMKEKSEQTKIERYGDAHYNNRAKSECTCLERYGAKCNIASDDDNINGRGTYHKRLKNDKEFREKVIEKRKSTCIEKFGEDYYYEQTRLMMQNLSSRANSKRNQQFASYLMSVGIPFDSEVRVGKYVYDFKLGKYLIEINPYATHNSTWGIFGQPKSPEYHRDKTLNAIDNGFECVHIFDWMNVDAIIFHIVNKDIAINDTGKPVKHIFDIKEMRLTNAESDTTVVIFDDGFDISY